MKLEVINQQDIPKRQSKYEEVVKKVAALKRGGTLKITGIEIGQVPSIRSVLRSRLLPVKAKVARANNGSGELYLAKEE